MSSQFKYTIVGVTSDDKMFGNFPNVAIANAFRNLGNHYQGVAVGSYSETVTLNGGPTYASGTITIASGNVTAAQTITIKGVVLTARAAPANNAEFLVGATALQTGISLAAVINAHPTLKQFVRATYVKSSTSAIITVTALAAGTTGNYTWSETLGNTVLSPLSALSGGADGPISATGTITVTSTGPADSETMTLANVTLTAKTSGAVPANGEFNISATPSVVATGIALAINSVPSLSGIVSATSNSGVVTVTVTPAGTIGNAITMVDVDLANTTVTSLSGGVNANVLTLRKGI